MQPGLTRGCPGTRCTTSPFWFWPSFSGLSPSSPGLAGPPWGQGSRLVRCMCCWKLQPREGETVLVTNRARLGASLDAGEPIGSS